MDFGGGASRPFSLVRAEARRQAMMKYTANARQFRAPGPRAMRHNCAMKPSTAQLLAFAVSALPGLAFAQGERPVYRCPGTPVLYTDTLSPQEAKAKGCTLLEGAPITVIGAPRPRAAAPQASGPRPADAKVDPAEQRARDSDARRILEAELRRAETDLAAMQKEYNNGQPERLGSERNFQRYLDRVADMKAAIARKESDIAAIKRELGKLPQ